MTQPTTTTHRRPQPVRPGFWYDRRNTWLIALIVLAACLVDLAAGAALHVVLAAITGVA